MKQPIFTGSAAAIVTPFSGDGVQCETLGALLDFQLENGTDAIVICGTTGEASTMTEAEQREAISCCVQHVGGQVPVIAGTGSNNTAKAVEQAQTAERLGVNALLVVTPYYNKATQVGLIRHYRAVADAVSIPVILYNVPSRTGVSIAPETYAALAEHPNIIGVKEASGNMGNIQKTRNLCPEDFYIWSGNDDETVPICALGGKGVISVAANVLPAEMHRLIQLCLQNDFAAAGALQLHLKEFCDAMFCEVNPIPVKTALSLLGWKVGELRSPLCAPSPEHLEQIKNVLAKYGLPV